MSKTYTGIKLLQAIKDGEIKRNTEFLVGTDTIVFFDGQILRYRNDYCGIPANNEIGVSWLRGNFKLLDKSIDIQSIEELPIYCPASDRTLKINELVQAVKQIERKINNK